MVDQKVTLPITGMTCANCAMNIERTVKKLNGIKDANVNFAAEQAVVAFDPKLLHLRNLVNKIHGSGYTVAKAKVEFPVSKTPPGPLSLAAASESSARPLQPDPRRTGNWVKLIGPMQILRKR